MRWNRKSIILITIFIIATILRFWNLGKVPEGISNDEAGYGMSALSIWQTGRSLDGKFLPLSFALDNSFAPVQIYIGAPFVGLFGISPFSIRLPFAILSVVSVYLLYRIMLILSNNQYAAVSSAFVLAISPWHIHVNRTSYDGPISFSFLLATYIFLRNCKKGSILWSLPFWAIAWYSYHATKPFFLVFIALLLVLFIKELLYKRRELLVFIIGMCLIILSFIPVVASQNVTRQNVLLWNDSQKAIEYVEWQRNHSAGPEFIKKLFNNKPAYYAKSFKENYLEALSPQFLFLYGETGGLQYIYGVGFRGVMYLIELPFLLFGIWNIIRYGKNRIKWFIFIGLFFAPLGSAISIDRSYGLRSIMMLPFLSIITGFGIEWIVLRLQKIPFWFRKVGIGLLVSFYIFSIVLYLYQYYFQYPIYASESMFQSTKDLSLYINKKKKMYENVYISDAGPMSVLQYGIWNNIPLKQIAYAWNNPWPKTIENVQFLEKCTDTPYIDETGVKRKDSLVLLRDSCQKLATPSGTIDIRGEKDQTVWKLYE